MGWGYLRTTGYPELPNYAFWHQARPDGTFELIKDPKKQAELEQLFKDEMK